ncbi:hypothetical protein [Alkalibacterium pelagium]|nr:hypothetical protein [Alkalibacterium pelagium]
MFGVRTLFINTLGVRYLGLNGVFRNIFQFLSLAELGIGSAISFRLYEPLSSQNERRISALMTFFKKAYNVISLLILGMSLALLPFINAIIRDPVEGVNIYVVFFIYVAQTLSTYLFFAYKLTLLKADQREYIISKYGNYIVIGTSLTEMFILYFFESFIGYLLVLVLSNILKNYLVSRQVDKDYAYIDDYDETIDKEELKEMFKDFFAAFLYRINSVVLNATDNLVLTYFVGLDTVGYYSNYVLITSNLKNFLRPVLNSVKASLGNFIAQKSKEESYEIFKMTNLLTFILYGGASIGLFILSNRFITVWIGEEYLLSQMFVLLIALEFYFRGIQLFLAQIRNAMGLFQQLKYRPVLSILINLILSIVLVQYFNIEGVILATIAASVLTNMIIDPIIIHSYGFSKATWAYYIKNVYYVGLMTITGYLSYVLTQGFNETFMGMLLSFVVTTGVIMVLFTVGLVWLSEFRDLQKRVRQLLKK